MKLYLTHVPSNGWKIQWGMRDVENDPRGGYAFTAQNLEAGAQVQKLVATDHQTSLKLIEDKLHINWKMTYHILHKDLG